MGLRISRTIAPLLSLDTLVTMLTDTTSMSLIKNPIYNIAHDELHTIKMGLQTLSNTPAISKPEFVNVLGSISLTSTLLTYIHKPETPYP